MVDVIFYEKPGCINNTKQKKILIEAGHRVEAKNLLEQAWTAEQLLAFFINLPVIRWFNQSAPAVKSGQIDPDKLTAEQAVNCILADPLLIRRPLMQVGDIKIVGFEPEKVKILLNLVSTPLDNLENCPREHTFTQ